MKAKSKKNITMAIAMLNAVLENKWKKEQKDDNTEGALTLAEMYIDKAREQIFPTLSKHHESIHLKKQLEVK